MIVEVINFYKGISRFECRHSSGNLQNLHWSRVLGFFFNRGQYLLPKASFGCQLPLSALCPYACLPTCSPALEEEMLCHDCGCSRVPGSLGTGSGPPTVAQHNRIVPLLPLHVEVERDLETRGCFQVELLNHWFWVLSPCCLMNALNGLSQVFYARQIGCWKWMMMPILFHY